MRCYWKNTEWGMFHIPGCWGAVIHGPEFCHCPPRKKVLEERVDKLEKEVRELKLIIKKNKEDG